MSDWIAVDVNVNSLLPQGREYTEVEALIKLTLDIKTGNIEPLREYARIWKWSWGRTQRFLYKINFNLAIAENPKAIQDRSKTDPNKELKVLSLDNIENPKAIQDRSKTDPPKSRKITPVFTLENYLTACQAALEKIGQSRLFPPLKESLVEFFNYRKEIIRQPVKSEVGVSKMIVKLVEESNLDYKIAQAMINQTIASEKWSGIFPVKYTNGKHQIKGEIAPPEERYDFLEKNK